MKLNQVKELISFGEKIGVKVTECNCTGEPGVHFRDFEMTNFVRAAIQLKHIQANELESNELVA